MNAQRNLCLLAVVDDPGEAGQLQLAVQQIGFAVKLHIVSDYLEALQFLRQQGERFQCAPRPDLILLDIKMPGQEYLAFLVTAKQDEHLRAIPVVVMSASELEADVCAAYHHGAAGYVLKPADINEFAGTINKLGQYWFERIRLPENCSACTDATKAINE